MCWMCTYRKLEIDLRGRVAQWRSLPVSEMVSELNDMHPQDQEWRVQQNDDEIRTEWVETLYQFILDMHKYHELLQRPYCSQTNRHHSHSPIILTRYRVPSSEEEEEEEEEEEDNENDNGHHHDNEEDDDEIPVNADLLESMATTTLL